MLHQRIAIFTALPIRSLDQLSLQRRLKEIGRMEGATAKATDRPDAAARATPRRGGARHSLPARGRGRLRHHGAEACGRESRAGAALQHAADRRDPGRADPDLRSGVGRTFQSGGHARASRCARELPWPDAALYVAAQIVRRARRRVGRAPDVRSAALAGLDDRTNRPGPMARRSSSRPSACC